jgi:hypothetical protein
MQIPEIEIENYLNFMTGLETWLGRMGYMMPSGCKFTLIFNTTRSGAYQALKYELDPNTAIGLTGDDTVYNGTPKTRNTWHKHDKQLKLKSKRQEHYYPTFCGWIMTPYGCFKDPQLLLDRTMFQCARNNLNKCFFSYAADMTPLYINYENAQHILTQEQTEAHFTTLQLLTAEAKTHGIKLHSDFITSYGVTRTYDLNKYLGGNSINPTKTTNKIKNKQENMPYNRANWFLFRQLENSEFISIRTARTLVRTLNRVDYSVVDSRREGHQALNDMLDNARYGEFYFAAATRFPDAFTDIYLTMQDTEVANLFMALGSSLSWRQDNRAKDSTSTKPDKGENVAITLDQAVQDNTKRFEELKKHFATTLNNKDLQWNRVSFEERTNANWA